MSLEGWVPEIGDDLTLSRVIEMAFDYRGNTTVVTRGGAELVGYIFNRNADTAEPFIEMFDEGGAGPFTIAYAEIATIKFTGKDSAAGKSYQAWLARKDGEERPGAAAPGR